MFYDEAKHGLYFLIFSTGFGVQTRRLQELRQRPGSKKELLQRKWHTHQQQRHQVLSLSTHHLLWQNVSLFLVNTFLRTVLYFCLFANNRACPCWNLQDCKRTGPELFDLHCSNQSRVSARHAASECVRLPPRPQPLPLSNPTQK